jgi:hypothetical protein
MSDLRAISDDAARDLLTTVGNFQWKWTSEELPALLRQLRWHIAEEIPDRAAIALTDWGLDRAQVTISRYDQTVNSMAIGLTNRTGPATDASRQFLTDTFAHLNTVATQVLGPATDSTPGTAAQTRWHLGGTTLTLRILPNMVAAIWSSTEYQLLEDQRAADRQ